MNHSNKEKVKKDNKHKQSIECLTKCIQWKLTITVTLNKSNTGLVNKNFTLKKFYIILACSRKRNFLRKIRFNNFR